MLIDFHQTFRRLIKSLGRIIFRMGKPCAKDVFTLQNMCQLKLIFLSRFQERVPMYFRIPTAQIRDSVLHRPIIRIVLIAAQSQLPDIAGGRHITQVNGRIPIPLIPYRCLIMFYGKRSVQGKFITETFIETRIEVQSLFATAGLHIIGNTCTHTCLCSRILLRIIIILITMVDTGRINGTIIQSPSTTQIMLLGKEEFPAIDALTVFGIKGKLFILHAAMQ